jgi:hypothetical protein
MCGKAGAKPHFSIKNSGFLFLTVLILLFIHLRWPAKPGK